MQEVDLLLAQNESFRYVECEFKNGRQLYTYKTLEEVEKGEFVVVDTPQNGLTVVKVVEVLKAHEKKCNFAIKWVVQKVDMSRYEELNEKEGQAQELINTSKTKKLVEDMTETLEESIGSDGLNQVKKLTRL